MLVLLVISGGVIYLAVLSYWKFETTSLYRWMRTYATESPMTCPVCPNEVQCPPFNCEKDCRLKEAADAKKATSCPRPTFWG